MQNNSLFSHSGQAIFGGPPTLTTSHGILRGCKPLRVNKSRGFNPFQGLGQAKASEESEGSKRSGEFDKLVPDDLADLTQQMLQKVMEHFKIEEDPASVDMVIPETTSNYINNITPDKFCKSYLVASL